MIPEEVYNIYQTVLQGKDSQLPVEVLAALHKTETNLSMTNECTSKEELVFYFGKKLNRSKEKPTPYTSEELTDRVTKMVEDVERFTIDGHTDLAELLTTRLKETESEDQLSEAYLQRVEGYLEQYQAMDELLIGIPVKDWNEKRQNEEAAAESQNKETVKRRPAVAKEQSQVTNREASLHEGKSLSAPQENVDRQSRNIPSDAAIQKIYTNQERQQEIHVTGSVEEVQADIFQTGQYAGSLEPSSLEEMEKLIHSYGFMAIDKEDYAKYSKEQAQQKEAMEYSLEQ